VFEHIGATLWDPLEIIEANGGTPPLTYAQFCHVTRAIDQPPRPKEDIDLKKVNFVELSETLLEELNCFPSCPSAEDLGYKWSGEKKVYKVISNQNPATHTNVCFYVDRKKADQEENWQNLFLLR